MDTADLNKSRSDAWDAPLDEARRWQVYDLFRRAPWHEVSAWIAKELGLEAPSRSALYRWAARMRRMESSHRLEQAFQAREEAGALAGAATDEATLVASYRALAADVALKSGDTDAALTYTRMSLALAESQRKKMELDLKARSQETKDAALRLAREKFEAAEARIKAAAETIKRLGADGGLSAAARAEIEKAMGVL
jgi:hypothetical protein